MNIIIAINEKYIPPAKTMLFSLFRNNREKSTVYLLHKDLTAKSVEELRLFLERCGDVSLVEKQMDSRLFADAPRMKWWSEEMYYRLLAFALIPEERALWLDADIIVNGDLSAFYHQDLDGYYCAACRGCNQSGVKRLGLSDGHIYFNSGVILYNLQEIRDAFTEKDVFDFLEAYKDRMMAPDQDILNVMFSGKIKYADEKIYNLETFGNSVISGEELKYILYEAVVIHFNGPIKPWDPKGANWADALWWKYEKGQNHLGAYVKYRVLNAPVKVKYNLRELRYMIEAQIKKRKG